MTYRDPRARQAARPVGQSAAARIAIAAATFTAAAALLAGCDNMANQPKANPYEAYVSNPSPPAPVRPPPGTVSRDWAPEPPPPPVTAALLKRGEQRYDIYCSPCHGYAGYGDGMIVQRGFPHPPSYQTQKLRDVSNQHIYDVITNGWGIMFSYAQRVAPADRWAIVAYIRTLQASQHASVAQLPPAERSRLP